MNRYCKFGHWVLLAGMILQLGGGFARAATVSLVVGEVPARAGAEVVVPVMADSVQKMGAMMLDLTYDARLLEAKEVEEFQDGDLTAGASVDANVIQPGRWRAALARSEPIDGKGVLLKFRFKAIGQGKSVVAMEKVRAWDQSTPPLEMLVKLQPGSVTVASAGGSVRLYAVIGVVAALLVGVAIIRSRKQPS